MGVKVRSSRVVGQVGIVLAVLVLLTFWTPLMLSVPTQSSSIHPLRLQTQSPPNLSLPASDQPLCAPPPKPTPSLPVLPACPLNLVYHNHSALAHSQTSNTTAVLVMPLIKRPLVDFYLDTIPTLPIHRFPLILFCDEAVFEDLKLHQLVQWNVYKVYRLNASNKDQAVVNVQNAAFLEDDVPKQTWKAKIVLDFTDMNECLFSDIDLLETDWVIWHQDDVVRKMPIHYVDEWIDRFVEKVGVLKEQGIQIAQGMLAWSPQFGNNLVESDLSLQAYLGDGILSQMIDFRILRNVLPCFQEYRHEALAEDWLVRDCISFYLRENPLAALFSLPLLYEHPGRGSDKDSTVNLIKSDHDSMNLIKSERDSQEDNKEVSEQGASMEERREHKAKAQGRTGRKDRRKDNAVLNAE